MARDVMAVRLHLPQIRVLEVVEDTPGALVVSVESTLLRLRCAQCGFKCRRVHDRRDKKVRDLEVSGRRTVLVWSRRRMVCDNCDSRFLEDHPAFEGALTGRLARRLVADAKVMTFNAVARRHGVHWHGVRALVDTWSALVAERRRSRRCSVLLVDETSMRKRHRYVTVIVNGDTGRTLAMVEHRNSAALSAFLMQQGHRWCKGVKVVVSDGSKAYKSAIDAHLGHARHVLDRFHVIRWFAAGAHPGAPRHPAPRAQRRQARLRPRGVPRPGSRCCAEATPSPTPTAPASTSCSTPTPPASKPAGRHCRSSTASTPPTTMTAPSKPSDGSATSTRPASCPSTTTPSTRSSHGPTRSSTGTTPATPPTAESRAPTTCSKCCDAAPTASPTHATSKPAASS